MSRHNDITYYSTNYIADHVNRVVQWNKDHRRNPYGSNVTDESMDGPTNTILNTDGSTSSRNPASYALAGYFDKNK